MQNIRHSLKERFLAFFMAFAMVIGFLPGTAWAASGPTVSITNFGGTGYNGTHTLEAGEKSVKFWSKADWGTATVPTNEKWKWTVDDTNAHLFKASEIWTQTSEFELSDDITTDLTVNITLSYYADETETDSNTLYKNHFKDSNTIAVTFKPAAAAAAPVLEDLTLTIEKDTLAVGETTTLKAMAEYTENKADVDVSATATYSAKDDTIVKITGTTVSALKAGTTTITANYEEGDVTATVDVTVTDSSTGGGTGDGSGGGTGDGSGDGSDNEEDNSPDADSDIKITGIIITSNNSGNSSSVNTTTLSTTGTKQDQLTVKLTAEGGTVTENANYATAQLAEVKWSVNPTSVVGLSSTGTTSSGAVIVQAASPGQATVTATYGNISAEFTVVVSGITVDATAVAGGMLTHSTSEPIVVTKYGDASGITWSSSSSGLLAIEVVSDDQTEAILHTNDSTGTGTIYVSSSDGDTSFTVTVNEAVASHIIPVDNINILNVLKFSDLISEFEARSKDIYPLETLVTLQNISVTPAQGTLYISYQNEANPGAGLASNGEFSITGHPSVLDIVFVPNADFQGSVAIIYYTGKTNEGHTFTGEIHATLAPIDDVVADTATNEPINMNSVAFEQVAAKSGKTIDYIVFTLPDENRATIYYDYKSADNFHHQLSQGEQLSKSDIDKLTVIPTPGYTGTLPIPYVITATDGTTLIGEMNVEVSGYGPEGPIVYNTAGGEHVTMITDDFHTNIKAITGYSMSYVMFELPDPSQGTLYELYYGETNYRALVTENTAYYAASRTPQISEVSFVPATGFTGSVPITFYGYDTQGNSILGTVEVNVGTQALGDINYICSADSYVTFYEGDINQYSLNTTGYEADYIYFPNMPSYSQGALRLGQTSYHDGTAVSSNTKYYYDESPLMGKLSFSAASNFSGYVSIPFEGVSVGGTEFAGTITVVVTNQNLVKLPINASYYAPALLDTLDFEHYSQERTDSTLDYVRFELPPENTGKLYYNYDTDDRSYDSIVTVNDNYYVNNSQYLSGVSFVPDVDFQGTVQISFTAWGVNGKSYTGVISVYVADSGDPLTYYIYAGDHIYLNSSAINDYCFSETGSNLNYVTLSNPTTAQGYLFRSYDSNAASNSAISTTTKLYKSQSPFLSEVAFVSNPSYIGSVALNFTAYALDGTSCKGTFNVVVRPAEANDSVYYYTSFSPIQLNESDIYDVWGAEAISYIEIHNTPTSTQGKLYYENNLASFATTSMKYFSKSNEHGPYINEMVFAPRAGFSGTMIVSYTATTVGGRSFSGDICVVVSTGLPSLYFNDMSAYTWATASVDYLYITQVSTGNTTGGFSPSSKITRGDYALMLQKAFRFSATGSASFSDVSSSAYYADAVNVLRSLGIATGYSNNTYLPNAEISRQDAMIMLQKAMEIANKNLPAPSSTALNQFLDQASISSYASAAMEIMVTAGMISGSSGGYLNPTQSMTRAEMAVVLHQAMTY